MGLSADQIKALLAVPDKKPRKTKSTIDTTDRSYATWFKLAPKGFGDTLEERPVCSNSNCKDDRPPIETKMGTMVKIQFTVVVNDVRMCRRCFLAGYGLINADQATLAV